MTAPMYIKISKNGAYITRKHDGIEILAPMTWIRQYVEYMLTTNQEIIVEVVP